MKRRDFLYRAALAVGSLALRPSVLAGARPQAPSVDGQRLNRQLQELAEFGRSSTGGNNRVAFSGADLDAREYVKRVMRAADLEVTVDRAGNLIGRREGSLGGAPPLMMGSHIDSVPEGGHYDGQVGSISAIEVAHALADHDEGLRHPLEVAIFANEEGGKTGSRAMSGEVAPRELDLVTRSGHTIREGIRILGGDPDRLASVIRQPGSIAAYLELHIEQGGILEREQIDIGVVEGIVGIKRWHVTVEGFANHAGTTPMDDRRDALLAAAGFIQTVNRVVREVEGRQVGTVGQVEVSPGAPNVIPGRVILSLEIRDLDMMKIDALFQAIESESRRTGEATGTTFTFDQFYVSRSAPTNEEIRSVIADAAAELGLSTLRMPSGAGHDAQSIAVLGPIGMIFVPSVGGISHSPQEFTHPQDIVAGANVLLASLLRLDMEIA